ncbi:MAG: preprotein translocase subunit SecG [Patescibacteria group bacterium]|nr:preprotein translocase subunit SecG [Patescibacteria group bacterium]MDE2144413.1 preprotein translocase subunit SecG [Patescibacteria group bacterium]
MNALINYALIAISIILTVLVILQDRGTEAGGIFGGSSVGGYYQQRRGIEKIVFNLTIILIAVFGLLSLANLIVK